MKFFQLCPRDAHLFQGYYSLTLQEDDTNITGRSCLLSPSTPSCTFKWPLWCSPVWQWENLIWTIQWNSEHASTYHLECNLSWRLKIARITVLWRTRRFNTILPYHNGYLEMIYVCQVHAYDVVSFARWGFTLDEIYVHSSHNLHALRFIS